MSETIYTNATIANSEVENIVHIQAYDPFGNSSVYILTRDEFMSNLKAWLRSIPEDQRQLILDELTACTLRTL